MLTQLLLWLYGHSHAVHCLLYHWYSGNLPGMGRNYINSYVRFQAVHYPHALARCLNGLAHHRSNSWLLNVCP